MQFGIIAYPLNTTKSGDTVTMGLIEYSAGTASANLETVKLTWNRKAGADFNCNPEIVVNCTDITAMASTGKILSALARIGKDIRDPVNLLKVLQKQLGRHVVYDPRNGQYVRVSSLKDTIDTQWKAMLGDKVLCIVSGEDEGTAKAKVIRTLSEKATSDKTVAKQLAEWLADQKVERANNAKEGEKPVVTDLTVYSRRSAQKKADA